MARRPMKYNPAFITDDEMIESFVVRHDDLDLVLQVVRGNTTGSNQHVLVTGPRGIGKTMLALRVVVEVRRDAELCERWHPIVFAEESYAVTTPGEFWLEAIFHIAEQTDDPRWRGTYEELKAESDEIRLRERALAQLMDFADAQGKRLLLVVENLNMLLADQLSSDDAWVIRHTLANEPRIMLLATATQHCSEFENSEKALFEMFKPHELQPLDKGDCRKVWTQVVGREPPPGAIRPVQILTGGNPRLLTIISHFGAKLSLRELMRDLMQLVDDHTEYFKSHLDNLAPVERKAYLALADIWDPSTARQVAAAARLDVSKTSSLLNRLQNRGAVSVISQRGRKKLYQVAERMYNIYYLMRRRGTPSKRVEWFVRFMVSFYPGDELVKLTRRFGEEACALAGEQCEDHINAIKGILSSPAGEASRFDILQALPASVLPSINVPTFERVLADERLRPKKEQIALIKRGVDKETDQGEAIRFLEKATDIDPDKGLVWATLGFYGYLPAERYDEAEDAFGRELALDPNCAFAWAGLGRVHEKRDQQYDEAEVAYRKAIELDPELSQGWWCLGLLLERTLHRYEEAEAAYAKATDLHPGLCRGWVALGRVRGERLGDWGGTEEAFRKAVELSPSDPRAWVQLGLVLMRDPDRAEAAESAFRETIALDETCAAAWGGLAFVLHKQLRRYKEAEVGYRKVISTYPDNSWAWEALGTLLYQHLDRIEEAEAAILKAIQSDPNATDPRFSLIDLRLKQGRADEAVELADELTGKHPQDSDLLNSVVWTFYDSARPSLPLQVDRWARKLMDASADNAQHQHTAACALAACGKAVDAMVPARVYLDDPNAVKKNPDYATELLVTLAAGGEGQAALEILENSPSAELLEPLIVGLKLFLGHEVMSAAEILEVGRDVAKRIEERRDPGKAEAREKVEN